MKRRNSKKKELITNIIGILIIVLIIAGISKYITSKKEASFASTIEENVNISQNERSGKSNNTNNTNMVEENKFNITIENTVKDNKNESSKSTNTVNENKTANNTTNTTTSKKEENKTTNTSKNTTNTTNTTKKSTSANTTTKSNSSTSQATEKKSTNSTSQTSQKNSSNNTTINNKIKELNAKVTTERQGVIYLTFDDGPSAKITPKILDILKEENVKATFFVINFSSSNEHLVKREVAEGHTIGIHGYSHEYSKIYKSKDAFMNNVYTLQKRIQDITGVKTIYTRFPGGSSNTVSKKYCKGIMSDLTLEMINKGFKYFDWNVSSGDAGGAKNASAVYKNVTKNLKKNRQNMVLMHDFASNQKGLDALRDIIKFGKENGYKFMAIDDKTPFFAQHVSN